MPLTDVAPIEATIDIDAPPSVVWALVGDLRNMKRWSPQNRGTLVLGGKTEVGATFFNLNRRGPLFWPTRGKVVEVEPERRLAFRISENWTVWSFELEATETGTRVTQRREAPQGISDLSVGLTKSVLGGIGQFTDELAQGMAKTLAGIKADAEK
ncbi:SRPBCC family protein [Nocardioides limicola]|uniref:SRPBCC family protein n=1 Tax=Nocardioides limicola TaxID=2803368 RepID=UPI00193B4014|nr:SRPBCC family protein [Nocardioides sp. DJM-14]